MPKPRIKRAIPLRRYQIGPFGLSVLGEVESDDPESYRYVLALVPEGENEPVLYVSCLDLETPHESGQRTIVTVTAENGEKAFGPDDRWQDLDAFLDDAIAMVQKVMQLIDETPVRLV